jgi:uncharacterized protein YkwD
MSWQFFCSFLVSTIVALLPLSNTLTSHAESVNTSPAANSSYDLINAVNTLRAAYGLAEYGINDILMHTAQSQADFMASTGNVTHSGPGGIGLTDRLLAAGYPLGGDLSAGGFRAENITSGNENRSAQSAVDGWTGDALHLNTMISPNLTEIGAGVAVADGKVYYVIDCALPNTGSAPQISTSASGSEATLTALDVPVSVAIVSTPNSDGDVIHEVKPGESLWQIAITYEVRIDDIKRLNNLTDNNIYPGNKLLIKQNVILPIASAMEAITKEVTETSTGVIVTATSTFRPKPTFLPTQPPAGAPINDDSIIGPAIGILALAVLGGWVFTRLGSNKKE